MRLCVHGIFKIFSYKALLKHIVRLFIKTILTLEPFNSQGAIEWSMKVNHITLGWGVFFFCFAHKLTETVIIFKEYFYNGPRAWHKRNDVFSFFSDNTPLHLYLLISTI